MILKFIFKYIIVIAIAQEIDQPARWPKIDQDHEFFATKSVLNAPKGLFQNATKYISLIYYNLYILKILEVEITMKASSSNFISSLRKIARAKL